VKLKIESGRGRRSRVWTLAGGAKYGRRESDFFFAAQRSSFGFVRENQRRSGEGVSGGGKSRRRRATLGGERGESRSFLRGRKGGVLARRGAVACGGVSRRVMDVKSE